MFKFLNKIFSGKDSEFGSRSSSWRKIRKEFLKENPTCRACGTDEDLEVHHIVPYHVSPEKELDKKNLITLCGKRCHFIFGHFCDWRSWNDSVVSDCDSYNSKRLLRPKLKEKNNDNIKSDRSAFIDAMLFSWNDRSKYK
jgi:hypothetical protein